MALSFYFEEKDLWTKQPLKRIPEWMLTETKNFIIPEVTK